MAAERWLAAPGTGLVLALDLPERPVLRAISSPSEDGFVWAHRQLASAHPSPATELSCWSVSLGQHLEGASSSTQKLVCADTVEDLEVQVRCPRPDALFRRVGQLLAGIGVELPELATSALVEVLVASSAVGLVSLHCSPDEALAGCALAAALTCSDDVSVVAPLPPVLLSDLSLSAHAEGSLLLAATLGPRGLILRAGWASLNTQALVPEAELRGSARDALSSALGLLTATRSPGTRGELAKQVICRLLAPRVAQQGRRARRLGAALGRFVDYEVEAPLVLAPGVEGRATLGRRPVQLLSLDRALLESLALGGTVPT